jgi:hypothetical protein
VAHKASDCDTSLASSVTTAHRIGTLRKFGGSPLTQP